MYGSFIPALSEHHAGGVNVGRTVINGERLGGMGTREQYLLGSEFAVTLRSISIRGYRELFRTYGLRSALYAEMVFGNMVNVGKLSVEYPQERIVAMRAPRAIPLTEITRKTGLRASEVKRFNPALLSKVPACANLYLPSYVKEFGPDVSFWHRPPSERYSSVLNDFLRLEATVRRWHQPAFRATLTDFQERFERTETEEGTVMATTLAYVISDLRTSRRAAILEDFRTNRKILSLFQRGVRELQEPARRSQGDEIPEQIARAPVAGSTTGEGEPVARDIPRKRLGASSVRVAVTRARPYCRLTFSARGPFGPWPTVNDTAWPSRRSSNAVLAHAD